MTTTTAPFRLICFPCAGCDGSMFRASLLDGKRVGNELVDYCQSHAVELCTPELSGRGRRAADQLVDLNAEVRRIIRTDFAADELATRDWALLGHSMGGICCYAFYYHACILGNARPPKFAILSASWDESMGPQPWPRTSDLSDADFLAELVGKWKLNPKVASDPRLWDLLKGRLRADFLALENHKYSPPSDAPFPVYHLLGSDDAYLTPQHLLQMDRWHSPAYRTELLPNADHALYHKSETRRAVFAFVIDRLKEHAPSGEVEESDDDALVSCF